MDKDRQKTYTMVHPGAWSERSSQLVVSEPK